MAYFDPATPRLLAHRGLALDVPENTIAAFEAAAELGVRTVETDVQFTRDGIAVCWHDPDLTRWDGTSVRVEDLYLDELQERRIDGQEISSVAEALHALPALNFNIDVKNPRAADATVDAVTYASAVERVLLTSFRESTAARMRDRLPDGFHGASGRLVTRAVLATLIGREGMLERALRDVDVVQIPPRVRRLNLVSPRLIAAYKRHVREVHVWTINDPVEMRRLIRLGVDGIVTDRVDWAVNLD